VYQLTCIKQKASDNSEVHRSLMNCGFSAQKLLHVILQAPTIWRRLLHFRKIYEALFKSHNFTVHSKHKCNSVLLTMYNRCTRLPVTNPNLHSQIGWKRKTYWTV